jgi:GH15 family glucan-1,4-alpha-glucosidase
MHKYWSDGSVGSSWHPRASEQGEMQLPIQLDETALVIDALWKHFKKYRNLEFISKVYPRLVTKPGEFLKNYVLPSGLPGPSFDMWEEKAGIFTSTASTVCAALSVAGRFARVFYDSRMQEEFDNASFTMREAIKTHLYDAELHRFTKGISRNGKKDTTIDSSLAFTFLSGTFQASSPEVKETMQAIYSKLWVDRGIGGLSRYENDNYHKVSGSEKGNPWFICTIWLARWHIQLATSIFDLKKGLEILSWVAKYALPSGILAEQLNSYDASPISVSPLIWSHAEFVIAVCEYIEKYNQLTP